MIPQTISNLSLREKQILIAGFFDGEGCISIGKNGAICVSTVNTCSGNIEFMHSVFGGTISVRNEIVNKPQHLHRLYGENAIQFLESIKDYLIEKRDQAYTTIEYYQLRNEIDVIFIPGERGRRKNPDRQVLLDTFREILSEQKQEWH